jgi:sec-independent protein translocase protein TatB
MREGSRCCTGTTPYDAPRLAKVFNLSGSEVIVLLLLALIVLGPERLPDAIRSFGRVYGQVRRMGEGFQQEMRSALEEPMRELRDTAELARRAVTEVPDLDDEADQMSPDRVGTDRSEEHDTNDPSPRSDPPATGAP